MVLTFEEYKELFKKHGFDEVLFSNLYDKKYHSLKLIKDLIILIEKIKNSTDYSETEKENRINVIKELLGYLLKND